MRVDLEMDFRRDRVDLTLHLTELEVENLVEGRSLSYTGYIGGLQGREFRAIVNPPARNRG
jgi:hypothetical protein